MTELQFGMLLVLGDHLHSFVRCCSYASGSDNIKTMHHKLGNKQSIVHMLTHENSHGLGCGGKSHCQMSKSMRLKYSSGRNVTLALAATWLLTVGVRWMSVCRLTTNLEGYNINYSAKPRSSAWILSLDGASIFTIFTAELCRISRLWRMASLCCIRCCNNACTRTWRPQRRSHNPATVALNLYVPCILYIGQTYRYSPVYAFYIFSQQIYFIIFLDFFSPSSFIPQQIVVYFLMLPFLVHKIFTFYINDVLNCKCPAPGPKG